jgi:hypothetical protein
MHRSPDALRGAWGGLRCGGRSLTQAPWRVERISPRAPAGAALYVSALIVPLDDAALLMAVMLNVRGGLLMLDRGRLTPRR